MGPVPPTFPGNGSDRLWLCRWLEANAASLRDLHVLKREAEERVIWALSGTDVDNGFQWEKNKIRSSTHKQNPDWTGGKCELLGDAGLVANEQGHVIQREIEQNLSRLGALELGPDHGDGERFACGNRENVPKRTLRASEFPTDGTAQAQDIHLPRSRKAEANVTQELVRRGTAELIPETGEEVQLKNPDWMWDKENSAVLPPDTSGLHRIGSGSWVPRLRLGSSGVTSDLLFFRRLSGNSLSTPSSGFCEASDIDSISSSSSSLYSEASCPTPLSMMSPHRSSSLRPRSTDCSGECRKDIPHAKGGAKRPMSAGALESSYFTSLSCHFDITQRENVIPPQNAIISPTLCVVQKRRRTERYIYKLALKYRCRPGAAPLPPDLGPAVQRGLASISLMSVCPPSVPASPQCNALSCSVGDVRKTPKNHGSWGKFLSRVMLRRDPRTAASEMNLELCGRGNGTPLVENHLQRAKSVRDLFSVSPFKRSQKGLNKLH
ncbi:uncharacterized protein LOC734651 [Xenopus laevis]|uniref:MGC115585 protein n=2 Tax=Xenopus laevis TaxID=8355 RepID=Q4KLR6_XENLA|nr:uncharacterized protein LOC734651 [Xenopus laevis]AAH99031.1 MGC115585 protein [Xenopus laevis]OCT84054.1 hypothetical protein XELAEV_18022192mg [Xenopus laevis]